MVIKVNENNTIVTASDGCMLYFKNDESKSLFSECGIPGKVSESDFVEVEIEIPQANLARINQSITEKN